MKTALITGATEGIGYEFVKLIALQKINIIMVARNEDRLKQISHEFSENVIQYYARDLSKIENSQFIYEDLKSKNISIDYLINNAGFGISNTYTDIPWENEMRMLNLNMISLSYFTKVFAKDMKERKFGRILNIASTGAFQPGPFMAGYCATKAFVLHLSEAVNFELKGTGVTVTTLCPGVTDTKFHDTANTKNTLMSKILAHTSAEKVAKYGLKIMMKGKSMKIQGAFNKIMIFMNRLSPRGISIRIAARLLKN